MFSLGLVRSEVASSARSLTVQVRGRTDLTSLEKIEKFAFNMGVDFFDHSSTNSLDKQNRKEYTTLTQKQISSNKNGYRVSTQILLEANEKVSTEQFELETEITGPLYRKICCFVCGPRNL